MKKYFYAIDKVDGSRAFFTCSAASLEDAGNKAHQMLTALGGVMCHLADSQSALYECITDYYDGI